MSEIHLNPEFDRQRRPVVDAQSTEEHGGIKPDDIIHAIFRHKWLIIIMAVLGLAGAITAWFTLPINYVSEAKILIRYVMESKASPSAEQNPGDSQMRSPDSGGASIINSELEILTSQDLAEEVAGIVGTDRILGNKKVQGDPKVLAGSMIILGLQVEAPRKSSVIRLSFSHPNPSVVQDTLNCLTTNYLQKHIKIHRAIGIHDAFFFSKKDELRSEIGNLESQIRSLKTNHGVVSFDEAKKANLTQTAKATEEKHAAELELAGLQATIPDFNHLNNVPTNATSTTNSAVPTITVTNPPQPNTSTPEYAAKTESYFNICATLSALQKKELDFAIQFTSEHSQLRSIRAQIVEYSKKKDDMEKEMPALAMRFSSPNQTTTSPNSAPSSTFLDVNKVASLVAKLAILKVQLQNLRTIAIDLDEAETQYLDLLRKKDLAEVNLKKYSASLEQSNIDKTLGPGNISNISIVENATPPVGDGKTKKKICVGILAFGLLGGLAWALLLDLFLDASIKRPADVKNKLKLPLFLWIPNIKELAARGKEPTVKKLQQPAANNEAPRTKNQEPSSSSTLQAPSSKLQADSSDLPADFTLLPTPSSQLPAPSSPIWSSYCTALRDRLMTYFEVKNMTHKPKLVAITSASQGVGVSSIAAELAALFSETGEGNVLLVDMNRDQGTAHPFYRGQPGCGISDALNQEKRENAQVQDNLYMATMDDFNGKLSTAMPKKFGHLVPRMKTSDYDYIIFDMPPVSQTSITARLAAHMDINLMVIEAEKDATPLVQEALEHLKTARANVGAVLNKRQFHLPKALDHEV